MADKDSLKFDKLNPMMLHWSEKCIRMETKEQKNRNGLERKLANFEVIAVSSQVRDIKNAV